LSHRKSVADLNHDIATHASGLAALCTVQAFVNSATEPPFESFATRSKPRHRAQHIPADLRLVFPGKIAPGVPRTALGRLRRRPSVRAPTGRPSSFRHFAWTGKGVAMTSM
jgi:hypothetical protein